MEQEALKRKARLQALRESRQKTPRSAHKLSADGDTTTENAIPSDTVEASVSGLMEKAIAERQADAESSELDISAIAPKRANWDLKRDLQKRLDQLKHKNDTAVANIIRKRVQESGDTDDLAGAIEAHTSTMSP
ncbi:hypothetical protein GQ54DRAFT_22967 [Martensiomyces pterosporus]|nr:hypothetical protein GQ54DRAFT_22967 [Martensiomyces pterosporus]